MSRTMTAKKRELAIRQGVEITEDIAFPERPLVRFRKSPALDALEQDVSKRQGIATWQSWILPSVAIGCSSAAGIMRMTRSSMLEAIRQDYIRTARAKGQKEMVIICVHALRNAIIPVMTLVGINFSRMLGGSSISEIVFAIPGLGNLIISAINVKNAPLVQGGILFIAVVMALCNLVIDVLYAYLDPRIRSQYVKAKSKNAVNAAVKKEGV